MLSRPSHYAGMPHDDNGVNYHSGSTRVTAASVKRLMPAPPKCTWLFARTTVTSSSFWPLRPPPTLYDSLASASVQFSSVQLD